MELQRILAKDTRAAMRQIHHLYGDDALVVSNNKARGQTEIIVAVDLDAPSSEITQEMHTQHKSRQCYQVTQMVSRLMTLWNHKYLTSNQI